MTPEDNAPKLREVVVASDPNKHGALVGHVGASEFPIGGPDAVGQVSPGPNPYDLLSASLAACTAMTVRFQAKRQKLPLERVEVGVSFHHGAEGQRDSFERTLVLEGELDAQQRAFLLEAANLCPVGKFWASAPIFTLSRTALFLAKRRALKRVMRMIWLSSPSRISMPIEPHRAVGCPCRGFSAESSLPQWLLESAPNEEVTLPFVPISG